MKYSVSSVGLLTQMDERDAQQRIFFSKSIENHSKRLVSLLYEEATGLSRSFLT